MKKLISLILVLILIFTLFASVSVLTPSADTGVSINVINAEGVSEANNGRAFFVKVDVTPGVSYTVSATVHGIDLNNTNVMFLVRDKTANQSQPIATSSDAEGTQVKLYSGATKWTDTVTTTEESLYIGMRFTKLNFQTAKLYMGNIEVINENGDNIAPALSSETLFYGGFGHENGINDNEASNWQALSVVAIDDITDEASKQSLVNSFYKGDAMLEFTGTAKTAEAFYKKISASNLEQNTTYKLTVKYSGFTFGEYDYIIIREGTDEILDAHPLESKTTGEIVNKGTYSEYTATYTTGEILNDLYIGFYLRASAWESASFNLGDMQFATENGENLFTPLYDTSDVYHSTFKNPIYDYSSTNSVFTIKTKVLDKARFNSKRFVRINSTQSVKLSKAATNLAEGKYRLTIKEIGLEPEAIKINDTPAESTDMNSYKYQKDIEVTTEGTLTVEFDVAANTSLYITEFSLFALDSDNTVGENLLGYLDDENWQGAEAESIKFIDATETDINGNKELDIADLLALKKLAATGYALTTNTPAAVRAQILTPAQ